MTDKKPYVPPSPLYIAALVDQLRHAGHKAAHASAAYNVVADALDHTAKVRSERDGDKVEMTALKVRGARAGNTDLADANRQYTYWSGEVARIGTLIQAEHAAMMMIERLAQ